MPVNPLCCLKKKLMCFKINMCKAYENGLKDKKVTQNHGSKYSNFKTSLTIKKPLTE